MREGGKKIIQEKKNIETIFGKVNVQIKKPLDKFLEKLVRAKKKKN